MVLLLQYTILFACILMLVALGGCFSEHSGVINLGLEGIMVMGAMVGALMMRFLPGGTSHFVIVITTLWQRLSVVCYILHCWHWRRFISKQTRPLSVRP